MHRCPPGGCTVNGGGVNDSRTNVSTIADGPRQLGEFTQGDTVWQATMDCVRETFAPFNITITDVDPGNVPHFENMVGGRPTDITDDPSLANAGGVAPFDCGEIPNAIVYTFDIYGPDFEHLCWTSAQEIAHAFGLEHEFLQKDPLTYLDGDLPKRFRDVDANCGEFAENNPGCRCRNKQNTYRTIVTMFGEGAPVPPTAQFKYIAEGKTVQPGFVAVVEALDAVRVAKVDLYIDGTLVGTASTQIGDEFELETPTDLAQGPHTIEARATDVQDDVGTVSLTINMGPPCTAAKGCSGVDVCVSGVCVPGPEEPGGLGRQCQRETECISHLCVDAGEGKKYCADDCQLANPDSCPSDFECIAGGTDGVCYPSGDSGCCDTGVERRGTKHGILLLGLGVALVLVRRRKRR